jgi:aspartyl-tRNA(Asn)/glutamyl-tRNA(Gln) amidotransferase subunit B
MKMRGRLPELPEAKRKRFMEEYGLPLADIENLISWKELNYYFEDVVSELKAWIAADSSPADINKLVKQAANWCLQEFSALLKTTGDNPADSKVTPENLAELIKLIDAGQISSSAGKQVLKVMYEKGGEPDNIVQDLGLAQVSDEGAIEAAVDKVIASSEKAVADYKAGQEKSFGFLVGMVMKEMKGQANPQVVNELLRKKLNG